MLRYIVHTFLCFIALSVIAKAHPINDYLNRVEREFDIASTRRQKAEIATQFVNEDYLASLNDDEAIDPRRLTKSEARSDRHDLVELRDSSKTCPLALSIVSGRLQLFKKFLSVVDDVNAFVSWGYRQKYSLAHVALDPRHPKIFPLPLETRIAFIDALGERKADFNIIFKDYALYQNPPLSAGTPSGRALKEHETLRLRGMLYGANPELGGSSFYGIWYMKYSQSNMFKEMMGQLFDWYAEKYDAGKGEFLCPTEKVKGILHEIARNKSRLDLLPSLENASEKQKREQALLEEKMKQEEAARLMREEEERLEREEEVRLNKIEEQREKERLEEARLMREEEEHLLREEGDRQREEKARLIREEEEQLEGQHQEEEFLASEERVHSHTQEVQELFPTSLSARSKTFLKECVLY